MPCPPSPKYTRVEVRKREAVSVCVSTRITGDRRKIEITNGNRGIVLNVLLLTTPLCIHCVCNTETPGITAKLRMCQMFTTPV